MNFNTELKNLILSISKSLNLKDANTLNDFDYTNLL